ncbi:Unconventional myosin-VIIb [Durusdinium trenchii]|uniref:Unconventional myosin-VIIb n=1 Tax=Durusdinium trenchii TaxID=1381693 RepID=A0ABP0L8A1_9DINO
MATKGRRIGKDWIEAVDPESGKVYYANLKTKETTWTMPDEIKELQQAKAKKVSTTMQPQQAQSQASKPGSGADSWLERQDPRTGRVYYYNPVLKQTSWTKPDSDPTVSTIDHNAGKGAWVARIDPRTNRTYYYNQITKMTSWTNPDEDDADKEDDSGSKKDKGKKDKKDKGKKKEDKAGKSTSVARPRLSAKRLSKKRLSTTPDVDDQPAYEGAGPAAPTNRTSARTSIRLGAIKTPGAGNRLSMADVARAKKAEVTGVSVDDEDVKTPPLEDRFAKLRALRNRAQQDTEPEDEVVEKQIDLENLTATALAEVTYDLNMSNYAEQYFSLKRRGGMFSKTTTVEKLLSWKPDRLKHPLHPITDQALVHDALLAHYNILHYCGDKPSRNPVNNAHKIFKITVNCPEELRDEVFCQLIKQTTANPDATSCLRGWELIAMCAGLFPPSTKLEKYLLSYIRRATEHQSYPGVGKLAEHSMLRVQKTIELGPRKEAPTDMEIEAVRAITPVSVQVKLLDGAIIHLEAESWTTIGELNEQMAVRLKIDDPTPFSLFEISTLDEERALDEEDRILDVLSFWAREIKLSKKSKEPLDFSLVYKVRLFFDILESDVNAIEVAYHQAVHDVTDSRYPCSEQDAFRLAALQAQEKFGDYDGTDVFGDELQAFLPAKFYEESIEPELKSAITDTYKLLTGYDQEEARNNYLDYVKAWRIYGSAYFFVEPQNKRELPDDCVLAINAKGVLLVDPETKDFMADYPYSEVVTWGHSAITFVLVVGNLIRQQKLYFKTDQGTEINALVHAYVNRLVEE